MALKIYSLLGVLRIIATFGIFIFHFLGLMNLNNQGIDQASIFIFCFISGYLSFTIDNQPLSWLYKRLSSIMIPYWFVIIPVVIANRIELYKETTILSDLITIIGGNLFLNNPIYVIAWYITFINILYLFIFFHKASKNIMLTFVIWLLGLIFFGLYLHKYLYFISFALGYFGASKKPYPSIKSIKLNCWSKSIFAVQDRSYAFFLIHGGVLIFLSEKLKMTGPSMFCLGILISAGGAIFLHKVTKQFISKATKKVLKKCIESSPGKYSSGKRP